MKKVLLSLSAATLLFTACESEPHADKAQVGEAQTEMAASGTSFVVDLQNSLVTFIGSKPVGKHDGTINIKEASITTTNNAISAASFTMDMTTVKMLDGDSTNNAKLGGHLMSPDFFDVAKYPTATFAMTGITEGVDTTNQKVILEGATHMVTGNLTLKDVTKSITFPARVAVSDANITADASFNIDRTQWNLVYGNDKSLGDKFIYPEVNIGFHIVANKQ